MRKIKRGAHDRGAGFRAPFAALGVASGLMVLSLPTVALAKSAAAEDPIASLIQQVQSQKAQIDAQEAEMADMRRAIDQQAEILRRAGLLDVAAARPQGPVATHMEMVRNAPSDNPPPAVAQVTPPPAAPAEAERPKSERAADQLLVDAGGVLLPRWTMQVEPSTEWTHISNPRVNIAGFTVFNAIVIGTIRVDSLSSDIINDNITWRMGLPFRTQVDVRVPYTMRYDRQTLSVGTANIEEHVQRAANRGDVSATFSWQPVVAEGWRPAVILRTRVTFPTGENAFEIPIVCAIPGDVLVKTDPSQTVCPNTERVLKRSPTGSGYYSIEPGATFVWRSDPLVLFAGASYNVTPAAYFNGGLTRINPGNTITLSGGLNFAVNERASINASFVEQNTRALRRDNVRVLGTEVNDARLGLGASFGLTNHVSLVVNAGMGLTDQSPGYTLSFSVPITLPLRH